MSEDLRKRNLRHPISKAELERRWKAVREAMVKENLDCLVMEGEGRLRGGNVRYFTDIPAPSGGASVVFPLEENLTIISPGAPSPPAPPEWAVFNTERVTLPYHPHFNFTQNMAPGAAIEAIKKVKAKSVGVVGMMMMSANYYEHLKEGLPGVTFKDATDMVDAIRAVKSQEEIEIMKKTCQLQDLAMAAALSMVRPGVREYEIMSEVRKICMNMGSEEQVVMIGSAPGGQNARTKQEFYQNRTLQDGDYMALMIETTGLGGLWTEIARVICLGEAPKIVVKAWKDSLMVQREQAKLYKPGAKPKDIWDFHNKLFIEMGYPPETRLACHSQGYDIVERPAIRPEETMELEENMVFAIHPMPNAKDVFVNVCDNFLVTSDGGVLLHKFPSEVFVV